MNLLLLFFNRHYNNPNPQQEDIRRGTEALGLGVMQHLRGKHGHADSSTIVEMRHDVFQYLFKGKGVPSGRAGHLNLVKEDFGRCHLPDGWDVYVDRLGDGQQINFPVQVRPFLGWGPQTHGLINGELKPLPRYCQEKVSICFCTSAYSINN